MPTPHRRYRPQPSRRGQATRAAAAAGGAERANKHNANTRARWEARPHQYGLERAFPRVVNGACELDRRSLAQTERV